MEKISCETNCDCKSMQKQLEKLTAEVEVLKLSLKDEDERKLNQDRDPVFDKQVLMISNVNNN